MPLNAATYQPGTTPLHALDARVKITVVLVYSIALFFVDTWWGMGAYAVVAVACLAVGRMRVLALARQLLPLWLILALTLLSSALGGAGILVGLFYVTRIVLILAASFVLTATTTASDISQAIESMLRPLAHVGVPVRDIAAVSGIALRFIPIIIDEFQGIRAAQASRGARFANGGIATRAKAWGGAFTPLFVGLYRRADRLAVSMDARCYGFQRIPSRLRECALGVGPAIGMLAVAAALVACAILL